MCTKERQRQKEKAKKYSPEYIGRRLFLQAPLHPCPRPAAWSERPGLAVLTPRATRRIVAIIELGYRPRLKDTPLPPPVEGQNRGDFTCRGCVKPGTVPPPPTADRTPRRENHFSCSSACGLTNGEVSGPGGEYATAVGSSPQRHEPVTHWS
jgi:hypothetical protein